MNNQREYRIRVATLKGFRFLDRYYAAHPRINAVLFSTINVFSIPSQVDGLKQQTLTFISKFVRNVIFYGPMFNWTLERDEHIRLARAASVRYKPTYKNDPSSTGYRGVQKYGNKIRSKFESCGFYNAWVRILSSFRLSPRIEMHSFRDYADYDHQEHVREHVRYLLSRFYPDANVVIHLECEHASDSCSSIEREMRVDRLFFMTVQKAMHCACTSATEIVLDGAISNETLIQYLQIFACSQR